MPGGSRQARADPGRPPPGRHRRDRRIGPGIRPRRLRPRHPRMHPAGPQKKVARPGSGRAGAGRGVGRTSVTPLTLTLSPRDLAEKLGVSPVEVIKKLMASKILAQINQVIDFATAEIVADEFGFTVEPVASEDVVAVESAEGQGDVVTTSREELFSLA